MNKIYYAYSFFSAVYVNSRCLKFMLKASLVDTWYKKMFQSLNDSQPLQSTWETQWKPQLVFAYRQTSHEALLERSLEGPGISAPVQQLCGCRVEVGRVL